MEEGLSTVAKGRRIVLLAKRCLEARGAMVEIAPNVVRWVKQLPTGKLVPRSLRHDFFGLFDIVAVPRDRGSGAFYQVTVDANVKDRRRKILAASFPHATTDAILGYVPGRRRHFRVYRGGLGDFAWDGETWLVPPDPKIPRVRAEGAPGSAIPAAGVGGEEVTR